LSEPRAKILERDFGGYHRIAPARSTSISGQKNSISFWKERGESADAEVLWLIVGAPEELEFLPSAKTKPDMSLIYPVDPKQLPKELAGVEWPPKG
jgi:hypothetical protein